MASRVNRGEVWMHAFRRPDKRRPAVNLDHVQTVERSHLHGYVGALDDRKMRLVCEALAVATARDSPSSYIGPMRSSPTSTAARIEASKLRSSSSDLIAADAGSSHRSSNSPGSASRS